MLRGLSGSVHVHSYIFYKPIPGNFATRNIAPTRRCYVLSSLIGTDVPRGLLLLLTNPYVCLYMPSTISSLIPSTVQDLPPREDSSLGRARKRLSRFYPQLRAYINCKIQGYRVTATKLRFDSPWI
ncbi:hypothetical protein I7I50_03305 [Histoplasma capsulatum G186AR]|uniref:Uncharacterized protein n=1 Tax=Ajellomyces capsulatus TaxID=5037 RepID=A0A8H7Z4B8_AJECA|nr:hypothetical protein I7I52_00026 [Histoplasma capsulatum]QSS72205.1 hypothetical protein I7I50_03305 [Histoplasma capsulatum G186AR]